MIVEKMNPSVKTLWLEALRSGKYKQGRNHLQFNQQFCCLGVLCEVAVEQGVIPAPGYSELLEIRSEEADNKVGALMRYGVSGDTNTSVLPAIISKWSGVHCVGTYKPSNTYLFQLTNLNDNGKTFAEIADVIEKYL